MKTNEAAIMIEDVYNEALALIKATVEAYNVTKGEGGTTTYLACHCAYGALADAFALTSVTNDQETVDMVIRLRKYISQHLTVLDKANKAAAC